MDKYSMNVNELNTAYDWCMGQLNELLENGCCVPPGYHDIDSFDALNLASLCVAKQIPKEVEIKRDNFMNMRFYCPICHKQQSQSILGKDISCERCGQRLSKVEMKKVSDN